ncbi:MAG: deoxyribodipyrimidine photo-lyase [Nitrospirales bacterium]
MTSSSPSIVWFQNDLRLTDNPALSAAVRRKQPLICLYVWNPDGTGYGMPGAASRWWLHHSLQSFSDHLKAAGNDLTIRMGNTSEVLSNLVRDFPKAHVFWNQSCEPMNQKIERNFLNFLEAEKVEGHGFHGNTLVDPSTILTQAHNPYRVFTPFWKRLQATLSGSPPLPAPRSLPPPPSGTLNGVALDSLELRPTIDWAQGIHESWTPGERGAQTALKNFLRTPATVYAMDRDRPDLPHTSRMSPHLHFGEMSPGKLWHSIQHAKQKNHKAQDRKSYDAYLRQIAWREFARYLLFHFPYTVNKPLYANYQAFPWRHETVSLRAWQRGLTGFPIVDAGMRELWHTGWMHNRVRMITASFLTKDLLLPWQKGAAWFWDTLVDADLANNTLGWQWVAGCGADASPFFRIFNPITQGITFDPDGRYVRKWVPELADLPSPWIHEPWEAPFLVLAEASITLGETYPQPMLDHAEARNRALLAYRQFKKGKRSPSSSSSTEQGKMACL